MQLFGSEEVENWSKKWGVPIYEYLRENHKAVGKKQRGYRNTNVGVEISVKNVEVWKETHENSLLPFRLSKLISGHLED